MVSHIILMFTGLSLTSPSSQLHLLSAYQVLRNVEHVEHVEHVELGDFITNVRIATG